LKLGRKEGAMCINMYIYTCARSQNFTWVACKSGPFWNSGPFQWWNSRLFTKKWTFLKWKDGSFKRVGLFFKAPEGVQKAEFCMTPLATGLWYTWLCFPFQKVFQPLPFSHRAPCALHSTWWSWAWIFIHTYTVYLILNISTYTPWHSLIYRWFRWNHEDSIWGIKYPSVTCVTY